MQETMSSYRQLSLGDSVLQENGEMAKLKDENKVSSQRMDFVVVPMDEELKFPEKNPALIVSLLIKILGCDHFIT